MIKWSDILSVNNYEIDEQHKKLIGIIGEIASIISKKDYEFSTVVNVIHELDDYVDEHFKYEEEVMLGCNYPEMQEQKAQHNYFRKKMSDVNVFDENFEKNLDELLNYLMDWLINHIMNVDKKLGLFLQNN